MFPVRFRSSFTRPAAPLFLALLTAAGPLAAAQTTPPKSTTAKTTTARTTTIARRRAAPAEPPLPKNIPPVTAPMKVQYVMRYQDIAIGAGAPAEPGQIYTVHYTGWLASDGTKFDSSYDRGKPIDFQQGVKRVIIGWDQGFEGMRIGGKRRLFIPYQLAYGEQGRGPIPPKANLIFDIELVDARDLNATPKPTPPAQ